VRFFCPLKCKAATSDPTNVENNLDKHLQKVGNCVKNKAREPGNEKFIGEQGLFYESHTVKYASFFRGGNKMPEYKSCMIHASTSTGRMRTKVQLLDANPVNVALQAISC